MTKKQRMQATCETTRLLSELDSALNQSSAMRDIVSKYEHLRDIESITGPSRFTRVLRKEIQIMESRLRKVRSERELKAGAAYSPA